jgi:hypothetical protein
MGSGAIDGRRMMLTVLFVIAVLWLAVVVVVESW